MMKCPNCGTSVQSDASFCGQCGFNLKTAAVTGPTHAVNSPPPVNAATEAPDFDIPDLVPPDPLVSVEPLLPDVQAPSVPSPAISAENEQPSVQPVSFATASPTPAASSTSNPSPPTPPPISPNSTQLQVQTAKLLHVQTNSVIEIPQNLSVVHVGKPNERVPPDIDVSGFPNSEIVSRLHADIRIEGDSIYIEDVGSSNGTYINNLPLPVGNRHRLRPGDRIALGKGDKVSFIFQLS